jgi:hypothetical protein
MEEKITFEDIGYEFQKKIVEDINSENRIPFLLKYYLIKEIWENIQENKLQLDMEVRKKHPLKPEVLTLNLKDEQEEKE